MHHFWEHMIAPILTLLQPKHIVKIGTESSQYTTHIEKYCREHGATLHCVDGTISPDLQQIHALIGSTPSLPILLPQDTEELQHRCQILEQERDSALQRQRIVQEKLLIMQERVTHLEKQLSYVNCSRSWRWTEPLRKLDTFLRQKFH